MSYWSNKSYSYASGQRGPGNFIAFTQTAPTRHPTAAPAKTSLGKCADETTRCSPTNTAMIAKNHRPRGYSAVRVTARPTAVAVCAEGKLCIPHPVWLPLTNDPQTFPIVKSKSRGRVRGTRYFKRLATIPDPNQPAKNQGTFRRIK